MIGISAIIGFIWWMEFFLYLPGLAFITGRVMSQGVRSFPCAFMVSFHVYGMCRPAMKDNMSLESQPGYIERVRQ